MSPQTLYLQIIYALLLSLLTTQGFILGQTEGCRGFGFVTFALLEDAQKAVNTVTTFHGRRLGVCFANKRPKHEKRKFKQDENAVDEGHDKHAEDGQSKLIFSLSTVCTHLLLTVFL